MKQLDRHLREVVRAFCVIALIFLSFGSAHASFEIAYSETLTPYVLSDNAVVELCLKTGKDNQHAHSPCHACRTGLDAALPPMPSLAQPAYVEHVNIAYIAPPARVFARPLVSNAMSRAPPRA